MPRFIHPFIIYLIAVLPVFAHGQRTDYYFTRLTEKEGVTDNHVTAIVQDSAGFIWIATYYGLNRYDGYSFDRFVNNPADTTTLSDNYVTCLTVDKNGMVWAGTAKGGLNRYNPSTNTFTHFRRDGGSANTPSRDEVDAVYADSKNRIWAGFFGQGWTVYDQQRHTFSSYKCDHVLMNGYAQNMYNIIEGFNEDSEGNIWLASDAGLYRQDPGSGKLAVYRDSVGNNNLVADNLFTNMYMPADSVIWLGTWAAGLKKFNTKTHRFTQYLFDKINPYYGIKNIVLREAPKSPNELWVSTSDAGLGVFNITTGKFTFFPNDPSNSNTPFPGESTWVFTDAQNSLWAGFDMGILRWNLQSSNFKFFPITNVVPKYSSLANLCFYKDTAESLLYTGGEGGKGLYVVNEKTGLQQVVPFPDAGDFAQDNYAIYSIKPVDANRLLILAFNGLNIYSKITRTIQKVTVKDQDGRQPGFGYDLRKGNDDSWWYGGNGVYKVDSGFTKAYHYYENNTPGISDVGTVLLAENDTMVWVNDNIRGLKIFNCLAKVFKPVTLSNGKFTILNIVNMLQVAKDEYWLTSYSQGLYKLTRNPGGDFSYQRFGDLEGIPTAFMKGIAKDRDGNYWVTSRKGPVMYNVETKHFKLFGNEDGFKADSWFFEDLYPAPDGTVYFTARGGYARTNIDSLHFNNRYSPLVIKSLKAAGKDINNVSGHNEKDKIELPYDANFFTVEFALLNYVDAGDNKYAYRLEGVDADFINCGTRRYVSYSDLSPGSYTLYIKAANNDGFWSRSTIKLVIVVTPPFWRTWLFYCFVAAFVGALGFSAYRYHINTIRKEEKLKTAFNKKMAEVEMKALRAQMNPHFIFNCLNSINRYIVKSDHVTASHYLTRFAKLIRLILDNSISDTTTLENEMQLIKLYLEMEQLRFEGKFTYSIETDDLLQAETIKIPGMLIQPYAENAIWHGLLHKEDSGHIAIRFNLISANILKIEIEDNGVGRKKSAELKSKSALKNKSYGMQITGDRINMVNQLYNINASATVYDLTDVDGSPAGTKVVLLIPIEQQA